MIMYLIDIFCQFYAVGAQCSLESDLYTVHI